MIYKIVHVHLLTDYVTVVFIVTYVHVFDTTSAYMENS